MSTDIYRAVDLETDLYVSLTRRWVTGYFDVEVSRGNSEFTCAYDYLPDAAGPMIDAVSKFRDDDAPTVESMLERIAEQFTDIEVWDTGDGPFLVDMSEPEDEG